MIDNLALGLSHGLMILAAWRLLRRRDLNDGAEPPPAASIKAKPDWAESHAASAPTDA